MVGVNVLVEIGDLDEDAGVTEALAKHIAEGYDLGGVNFPSVGWRESDNGGTGMVVPEVEGGRVDVSSYGLMSVPFDLGETSFRSRDELELGRGREGSRGKDWPRGNCDGERWDRIWSGKVRAANLMVYSLTIVIVAFTSDGRGRVSSDGGGGVSSGWGYADLRCNFHLGVWGGFSSRSGVGRARSSSHGGSIISECSAAFVRAVIGVSSISIALRPCSRHVSHFAEGKARDSVPVVAVFVKLRPGGRALGGRVAPPAVDVNGGWDG